jgi:hypothetical protein
VRHVLIKCDRFEHFSINKGGLESCAFGNNSIELNFVIFTDFFLNNDTIFPETLTTSVQLQCKELAGFTRNSETSFVIL